MPRSFLKFLLLLLFLLPIACKPTPEEKFSGTLEFTEHGIGARVAGRMLTMNVDEGDSVKQGELISTLDRYDQTKRDYERISKMVGQGGATQQEKELAQLAFEDQQVVSPIDGVVLTKVHESGEVVGAGSVIVILGDLQDSWVKIFIPEGWVNRVKMNQPATIKFDGLAQTFHGHVSFISPKAEFTPRNVQTEEERVTQTFAVKIKLDEREAYLRPGVNADVFLDLTSSP
jgi:HlyD family secretion protein